MRYARMLFQPAIHPSSWRGDEGGVVAHGEVQSAADGVLHDVRVMGAPLLLEAEVVAEAAEDRHDWPVGECDESGFGGAVDAVVVGGVAEEPVGGSAGRAVAKPGTPCPSGGAVHVAPDTGAGGASARQQPGERVELAHRRRAEQAQPEWQQNAARPPAEGVDRSDAGDPLDAGAGGGERGESAEVVEDEGHGVQVELVDERTDRVGDGVEVLLGAGKPLGEAGAGWVEGDATVFAGEFGDDSSPQQ